jgi:hypothetical protein
MPPKKNSSKKASGGPGRSVSRGRSPAPASAANPFNAFNEAPKPAGVRPAHLNEANKKVRDFMAMTGLPYRQAQQTLKNLRSKSGSMPASRGRSVSRGSVGSRASSRGSVSETVAAPASAAKKTTAWTNHVRSFIAANPGASLKKNMNRIKAAYKKANSSAAPAMASNSAAASYNPFNNNALWAPEEKKLSMPNKPNKTRKSKKSVTNASGAGSAAAAPNKKKRTRAKGPWNAHVNVTSARMKAENPKVTRQEVMKEAGRTYAAKSRSAGEQLGFPASVANNNNSNSNSSVNLLNIKGFDSNPRSGAGSA